MGEEEATQASPFPDGFADTILKNAIELWFDPELQRRKESGQLAPDFTVLAAQVLFSDSGPLIIRFNNEVKGSFVVRAARPLKEGDEVHVGDFSAIEGVRLPAEDEERGHFTIIRVSEGWAIHFDFLRNKGHARDLIALSRQYAACAEFCIDKGWQGPAIDNLFNACELLARARLVTGFLDKDVKTHGRISSAINQHRRLGNVDGSFVDLFNRLSNLRADARYRAKGSGGKDVSEADIRLAQVEADLLEMGYRDRVEPTNAPGSDQPP